MYINDNKSLISVVYSRLFDIDCLQVNSGKNKNCFRYGSNNTKIYFSYTRKYHC